MVRCLENNASDYLTEKVQRFAVLGDQLFLDEYFEEAFEANHREEAIATMAGGTGTEAALEKLQAAMDSSVELMNREYYAMRLVIEAQGYTEYPEILQSVTLSDEDMALSPDDQMRRAAAMVHDDEYYEQKDLIRQNMRASLDELVSKWPMIRMRRHLNPFGMNCFLCGWLSFCRPLVS